MKRKDLIKEMKAEYQIEGSLTILDHGLSVYDKYKDLINNNTEKWRLPRWYSENKEWVLQNIHSHEIIKEYTIMHDCGKPFCKEKDEYG
mgnify:CR=1 FL=1|tara:strand:+ start:9558 stop:9824 length:267 start_codon:yes stop_codon:yes gene_type:complete